MIKIEINAENGADARKELIDLLGLNTGELTAKVSGKDLQFSRSVDPGVATPETVITTVEGNEVTNVEVVPDKKKRRTKAEIEAEALAANTGTEEPPASEVAVDETPAVEFPALVDLQRVCAILVRAGYKDKGIELIKTIGDADSSKDVAEAKRADVIAAMTAFAEENKIAL